MEIGDADKEGILIDLTTAQAIRSGGRLKPGDIEKYRVLVDSITVHNRTIGVYLEGRIDTPVKGDLVDPIANEWPNIYQNNVWSFLEITAKPLMDSSETIQRLTVMDAREISESEVTQEIRDVAARFHSSRRRR